MGILGEVAVTFENAPLSIEGKASYFRDSKSFYDSEYVKVCVEHIERTE
jgi:hypothetical protein